MQCPRCAVPLTMTDRQGVEIDYCSQCRGVWLDRGEMDKIVEREASYAATPRPPAPSQPNYSPETRYSEDHRRGYGRSDDDDDDWNRRGGRKKRGWLGELFDFD
ncbi:MAG: zf-TFIIB domain-containing protein [Chloroflexota bacterium]